MNLTSPSIFEAQNTADHQRLVAAQSRSYSDAKVVFFIRVAVVAVLGFAGSIFSILFPQLATFIGGIGGAVLFGAALIIARLEKTFRVRAAMIQEEFDVEIFQLSWNGLAAEHQSRNEIARLAARYRGGRAANWYDPTERTLRPFDVLICQEANLGWGATMHWIWGWMLVAIAALLGAGITITELALNLPVTGFFLSLIVPFLALFKEIVEQTIGNFDMSNEKRSFERKVGDCWRRGINGEGAPSEYEVRSIQDRILSFRLANPYVPDWLDRVFHSRNEAAMKASVQDRNSEAVRAGLVG